MHGVEDSAWFALQVGSRKEKAVASSLSSRGFQVFLPVCRERRRWSDRMQELEVPLFPGYLFCHFNPLNRFPIVSIPTVRIVGIGRNPVAIAPDEIRALRAAVDSEVAMRPCPYFCNGQRVIIEHGPLRGVEGIVTREKNRMELILSITLLERSVALTVDAALVSPAPLVVESYEPVASRAASYVARRAV